MKRKKSTRAYKQGYTAGCDGQHSNKYYPDSVQHADYERGFTDGTKFIGVVFTFVPEDIC